jgi:Cu-processing system ATP-binding protein
MTAVLNIRDLTMRFGAVEALRGVTLQAGEGERIALLGHNGAGKTTMFRLLLGFLAPTTGMLAVCGGRPGGRVARQAISYLPESVAFPKNLTGVETAVLYARLKRTTRRAAIEALDRVGLGAAAARRVGEYSKGMRQRLGLAIAALGAPRLILLDEPTSGLDPQSRSEFYGYFRNLSATGATILFSSHTLNDINGAADRIVILKAGAIVGEGEEAALRAAAALPVRLRLRTDENAAAAIAMMRGGRIAGPGVVEMTFPAEEKMQVLGQVLEKRGLIRDFEVMEPTLSDIYRALCGEGTSP